jgi:hypothetical protein
MEPEPYKAFCDDSNGVQPGKILLLSALIHTVSSWSNFTGDWEKVLHEKPSIRHFHMREARALEGEFARWKPIDRDLKIISLTEVVLRYEPHLVSCWLSTERYVATIRQVAPADLRHAFYLAFLALIHTVAEYQLHRGISIPVDFVFDNENDVGNEALLWYPAIKAMAPKKIQPVIGATPEFRDDEEVLPLQAADLVAWHKRRRKETRTFDTEVAASQRVDELPGAEREIPEDALVEMASELSKVPSVELFREGPSIYKKLKRAYRKGQSEI